MSTHKAAVLEAKSVRKTHGSVVALDDVSIRLHPGTVTCLLGDNGAGKSTLISILSGVSRPDGGTLLVDGEEHALAGPADALEKGIATVFQDLALVPVLPVYRNFFMGREPTIGRGAFRRFDRKLAQRETRQHLAQMGVELVQTSRPLSTLSGGQRQAVAIARAMYFGARVLLLDEPTAALGVKQSEMVLRYAVHAKSKGVAVVLITHNAHHAWPVGDRFVILRRGKVEAEFEAGEASLDELMRHMAGGEELQQMQRDLRELSQR